MDLIFYFATKVICNPMSIPLIWSTFGNEILSAHVLPFYGSKVDQDVICLLSHPCTRGMCVSFLKVYIKWNEFVTAAGDAM